MHRFRRSLLLTRGLIPIGLALMAAVPALAAAGPATSTSVLDAAGLAPALEAAFPPSVAYLDCPFRGQARTCVLLPGARNAAAGERLATAFLRGREGIGRLDRIATGTGADFRIGDTDYRLVVTPSRARLGSFVATLSFALAPAAAAHAVCVRPGSLFDLARLPSLSPAEYGTMATAAACRGPDPVDAQGRTPLYDAAATGNLAAARTLLRAGADPNHIANDGWTPLLAVARSGTRPVLEALLQAGGDPGYVAPDGAALAALAPFNRNLGDISGALAASAMVPPPDAVGTASAPIEVPGPSEPASATATHGAAAPRSAPRRLGLLPLWLALAALTVMASLTRLRATRPDGAERDLTTTATHWEALAGPRSPRRPPRRRERAGRTLEPAAPWNEPLS